jgi:hypothetical protein
MAYKGNEGRWRIQIQLQDAHNRDSLEKGREENIRRSYIIFIQDSSVSPSPDTVL